MNKKLVIGIIILIILVVATFALMNRSSAPVSETGDPNLPDEQSAAGNVSIDSDAAVFTEFDSALEGVN